MGGAVGDELDRADRALGTPARLRTLPRRLMLASTMPFVLEDEVRWLARRDAGEPQADMVYLTKQRGGRCFFSRVHFLNRELVTSELQQQRVSHYAERTGALSTTLSSLGCGQIDFPRKERLRDEIDFS